MGGLLRRPVTSRCVRAMSRSSPAARSSPRARRCSFPESDGTHAKISSLYGTQVFENKFVLQFGRFNTLDLYSAHPFTGGEGIDRFMNLSLVAPPISARTVPPSTEGVIFSVLKGAHPALTLGLIESTEDGFFENGATFMWNAGLAGQAVEDAARRRLGRRRDRILRGHRRSTRRRGRSSRRSAYRSRPCRGRGRSTSASISSSGCTPMTRPRAWASSACSACPTAIRAFCARRRSSASAARRRSKAAARTPSARPSTTTTSATISRTRSRQLPAHPQRAGCRALLRLGARRLEPGHRRPAGHRPVPPALRIEDLLRACAGR